MPFPVLEYPSFTYRLGHPVPVICEDKWPEDKCMKMMEADKCEKVGKNCKLTCDMCDDGKCKDKMPSKKCKKIKEADKCDKNKDKCMKTCDFCDDHGSGSGESGEGGKCKDLMPSKKCVKFMEAGKCNDTKISKKCMKTCDMCEDMGPKKSTIPNLDLLNILSSFSYWTQKSPNKHFQKLFY